MDDDDSSSSSSEDEETKARLRSIAGDVATDKAITKKRAAASVAAAEITATAAVSLREQPGGASEQLFGVSEHEERAVLEYRKHVSSALSAFMDRTFAPTVQDEVWAPAPAAAAAAAAGGDELEGQGGAAAAGGAGGGKPGGAAAAGPPDDGGGKKKRKRRKRKPKKGAATGDSTGIRFVREGPIVAEVPELPELPSLNPRPAYVDSGDEEEPERVATLRECAVDPGSKSEAGWSMSVSMSQAAPLISGRGGFWAESATRKAAEAAVEAGAAEKAAHKARIQASALLTPEERQEKKRQKERERKARRDAKKAKAS